MTISNNSLCAAAPSPAVSIVIPAFNSTGYLSDTLDSVLAQTFTDYEVIVVNDGSKDTNLLERILEEHPLPIRYIRQQNKGVSAARNAGIKIARGTFYAQLDADDRWKPEYLSVQMGILSEHPDVALVYPNAMIFGDSSASGVEFMEICPSEGEANFESLVRQHCTVMTCVTARMEAIKNAGTFDEAFRSCEDFDLWLRIVKNGGRIIYHRQVLAWYRRHEGSLSSDRVLMTSNLIAVLEKAAKTLYLTSREKEIVDQEITRLRAQLRLFEGKQALNRRESVLALKHFEEANEYLRSAKLALVVHVLRYLPRAVIWTFTARERLLTRRHGHQLKGIDIPSEIVSRDSDVERHV